MVEMVVCGEMYGFYCVCLGILMAFVIIYIWNQIFKGYTKKGSDLGLPVTPECYGKWLEYRIELPNTTLEGQKCIMCPFNKQCQSLSLYNKRR